MSPTPTAVPDFEFVETYLVERRTHQRYPITLDVEYRLLDWGASHGRDFAGL